jgi:hypothetical protein
MNAATKYVATHRPDSLGWGPFEGLGPDIVEGVRRIKAKDGPDLIVWGSSTLTSMPLEHGLAETPPRKLALAGAKAVSSVVIISTYTPAGPLRTGSFNDTA